MTVAAMAVAIALSGDGSGSDGGESAARPVCGGPPAPLALLARDRCCSPRHCRCRHCLARRVTAKAPLEPPSQGVGGPRPGDAIRLLGSSQDEHAAAVHCYGTHSGSAAALWRHPGCAEHRRCVLPSK